MRDLSVKQLKFVAGVVAGKSAAAAARDAGYAPAKSRRAADRLLKLPAVQAEVDRHKSEIRANTEYSRDRLIDTLNNAIDFAKANKNSMAVVKAVELIAKLSGHLSTAEVEIKIDIGAALAEARSRAGIEAIDVDFSELKKTPQLSKNPETERINPFDD